MPKPKRKVVRSAQVGTALTDRILVALLRIDWEHHRKLRKIEAAGGIELGPLHVDLCRLVLDAIGIPPDNSVDLIEAYGADAESHPQLVDRDLYTEKWFEILKLRRVSDRQFQAFVDWCRGQLREMESRISSN